MPEISINIDKKELNNLSKRLKNSSKEFTERAVVRIATIMERTAKENIRDTVYSSPATWYKRTGKARQSIVRSSVGENKQRVYMGVKYGRYLEEGTGIYAGRKPFWTTFGGQLDHPVKYKGMRARPFWKPAIETTKGKVPDILREEARKI